MVIIKGIVQLLVVPNLKSSSNLMLTGFVQNEITITGFRNLLTILFCLLAIQSKIWWNNYTACPKKSGTADFQYLAGKKCHIFLTSLDKTSSAKENDTRVVKFGWVILNLCTLLEIQSFSNFAGFLGPMSEEFCRDRQSIPCPVEAHCSVFLLLPRINGLPQNTVWKGCPTTILRSSVAKIQRNLKMTVFQEMVIESKLLNQI